MAKRYARRAVAPVASKTNPAYASVRFSDLPQPVMMPKNYRAYAREAYTGNDSVYKCIKYIIQNGAAIPPKLYTDETHTTEIPKHPLLALLKRPNPEQTGVEYREAVLGYYLIAGNSYQLAIRATPNAAPGELWTLEPNKVQIMPSRLRGIEGYKYEDFPEPIPPANMGRMRSWNPTDPIYGMSPIEVAAITIDMQTAAKKWNLALLQNYARPPGAWVVPVAMSKNDRADLEAKVNQKMAGFANAGKAPVLDAGMTWQSMAVAPTDLDWIEALKYNAGAIANLFDIPPQIIGDTSATTYNNMEQAKVASYTEAIFPALDKLYALWNNWLIPLYPDLQGASLSYDKASIEVIQNLVQAQKSAEATRAVAAYMAGACTLNQALVTQGYPDIGQAGEVYRVDKVLIPADKLQEYAEQSLTTPAAPPKPSHETADGVVPLPDTSGSPSDGTTPPDGAGAPSPSPKVVTADEQVTKRISGPGARKAASPDTTYLVWSCDPDACAWCRQNDGVIVASGDPFPNGCTAPDDSHRFCKCSADEIAVPDALAEVITTLDPLALAEGDPQRTDPLNEEFSGDGATTDFTLALPLAKAPEIAVNGDPQDVGKQGSNAAWYWSPGSATIAQGGGPILTEDDTLSIAYIATVELAHLIAQYAIRSLVSRHDRDVAAQANTIPDDEDDDDEDEDGIDPVYAKRLRRQRRASYRAFREAHT